MNNSASDPLGSTGDPLGVPPSGGPDRVNAELQTRKPPPLNTGAPAPANATPISVGESPTEAGGSPTPPFPPPRIPDHELIKPIGRGAYGEVWIARSVTGAFRAVKIVRRSSFDHERPFEREFEGIQKFEPVSRTHDSQVDILHVGRGEDYFYYVMELADDQATGGQINPDNYHPRTLKSDLLFRSRLPFEECVSIGIALTTALEHLHKSGLVHRDVKPSNIIFVNGVAKLADIGLVTGVDTTRSYVGTEGFAAPEGPGTAQGDLFSLGKVLYEMSTGKDRQEFPELPTNLRELPEREGLVELNAVIARACRHDPADRYTTAAAMRADLELLQSGKSLARLHRMEKQLRVLRRTGAVVAVLVVLILAGWFYQVRQTRIVREMANANSSLAKEKSKLAEEKTALAEENRERLVRLNVANGVRLMDAEEMSAGLLWFAEALPLVTNKPAEESIHRIRIQQVIEQTPRLLLVVADDANVLASGFSPDGNQIGIGSFEGRLRILDSWSGRLLLERTNVGGPIAQICFSRDGKRLLLSSSHLQGLVRVNQQSGFAAVFDVQTGTPVFHTKNLAPEISSNIVFSTFSVDDRWLAVAPTDNNILVLDAHDGHLVTRLEGHTDLIRMLMFNAEGTLLASASKDRTARVWRIPSGEPVGSAIQHTAPVRRAVFNPDGKRLATATDPISARVDNFIIQVWDIQSGLATGQPIQGTNVSFALAFDERSGKSLLMNGIVNGAKAAGIWDADTHEPRFTTRFGRAVRSWAFSPDGSSVAIGSEDGGMTCIWSLASGELLFPPFRHNGWVESVHFSPDGSRLLTTSDDGAAKVWSLKQQREAALLPLSANHARGPSYEEQPRGRTPGPIPAPLADDTLHLIDPDTLTDLGVLPVKDTNGWDYTAGHSGRCWTVSERFGDASPRHTVALWLTKDKVWRRHELSHPSNVVHLAFNADDSRLFTHCKDLNVRVWRTSDGGLERSIAMPPSSWSIRPSLVPEAFRPDCSALLLGYGPPNFKDGHYQMFDLASGELTGKPFALIKFLTVPNRMRLSPDGTRLASVGDDQSGTIINLQTGELAAPRFKHGGSLYDLDWSPDGKRLITAGLSPEIKLWDAATGEMLLSPMSLSSGVMAARWSADGRFIVGRSDGGFVRVWDATTTEAVTPMLRHSGYIQWACITPGNRLITASDPNLLRSWELKPTALAPDVIADYAMLLAGRRLGPGGTLRSIKSAELAQLYRSLRAKSPQLFDSER